MAIERRGSKANAMTHAFDISAYPKRYKLTNGEIVVIRPLQPRDEPELNEFFIRIPLAHRLRLHHDVADPRVLGEWTHKMNSTHSLALIAALDGQKIIADAALLRHPTSEHVAEIRITLEERFRRTELPELLLRELVEIAEHADLDSVTLALAGEGETDLVRAARHVGFREVVLRREDGVTISALAVTLMHMTEEPDVCQALRKPQ